MDESIPPCNIRIDKNGVWYFQGAEIIRQDILEMFYSNMEMDDQGRYLIRMGKEVCWLEVEDTPWIIKEVNFIASSGEGPAAFHIGLSDDSVEVLNLDELWIGEENVLYCKIKGGRFHARFSRSAYYEFSKYIQYDESSGQYSVTLDGKCSEIKLRS
jgi:hypothetical protein